MPERFFELTPANRAEALELAAARAGRPAHILEKDVWVVWVLSALFESRLASVLTFKGGTSLSKAYRVIDRFSEDIDLTYDMRELLPNLAGGSEPLPATKSQAKKWTDAVRARLPVWIAEEVTPIIRAALERDALQATISRAGKEDEKLLVNYDPLRRGTGYVGPQVVLEFGGRSTGEPHEVHHVTCDMAGHIAELVFPEARPQVLSIARTFWEKATAAHVYCRQAKLRSERFSRHWHDLVAIMKSPHFVAAVNDKMVSNAVAEHKSWFFVEKDGQGDEIDYRSAVNGELRIVPQGAARTELATDYAKMIEDGILLRASAFEDLMAACRELESHVNNARG